MELYKTNYGMCLSKKLPSEVMITQYNSELDFLCIA